MPDASLWGNLPDALKARKQWCVSNPIDPHLPSRKAPRIARMDGALASVNKPENWSTFEEAARYAYTYGWNIGFVLTREDDVCCIDMDVKTAMDYPVEPEKRTSEDKLAAYQNWQNKLDSYTERSAGGNGFHVWVRAATISGARFQGIEVYSSERYIICTGDVVRAGQIAERQAVVDELYEIIRLQQASVHEKVTLIEVPQLDGDAQIWNRAVEASNATKFKELCGGDWHALGYPSQSEADLALMSIFTFYSKSNAQCRRLFRLTELGKRLKAQQNDVYLNRTLTIIRSRQEASERVELAIIEQQAELVQRLANEQRMQANGPAVPAVSSPASAPTAAEPPAPALPPPQLPPAPHGALQWPPGLVGDIARFIYDNAPRPVREVAIVSALGLFAGIVGLGWSLPQSGLNLYMILIARSAIGKEAMHTGISSIISGLMSGMSEFKFVDFNDYASGQALQKSIAKSRCMLNVSGEWGHTLERLSQSDRNPAMASLRKVMTHLYQKSGPGSIVGGINYSKKDDNVGAVDGVSFSLIGETTPARYYDSLTPDMMEDGFLSRFTMIEYTGDRPPLNSNPPQPLSSQLKGRIETLVKKALLQENGNSVLVERDPQARILLDEYDKFCDNEINSSPDNESWRQMWNRAHLKVMRIAAIFAVCEHPEFPVMHVDEVEWAIDLVTRDIDMMKRKMEQGDVGSGDASRERKLLSVCRDYLTQPLRKSYGSTEQLKKAAIAPRQLFQCRTANISNFYKHPLGATRIMDNTLRSLCESGKLREVDKTLALEKFGQHGKLYYIIDID